MGEHASNEEQTRLAGTRLQSGGTRRAVTLVLPITNRIPLGIGRKILRQTVGQIVANSEDLVIRQHVVALVNEEPHGGFRDELLTGSHVEGVATQNLSAVNQRRIATETHLFVQIPQRHRTHPFRHPRAHGGVLVSAAQGNDSGEGVIASDLFPTRENMLHRGRHEVVV